MTVQWHFLAGCMMVTGHIQEPRGYGRNELLSLTCSQRTEYTLPSLQKRNLGNAENIVIVHEVVIIAHFNNCMLTWLLWPLAVLASLSRLWVLVRTRETAGLQKKLTLKPFRSLNTYPIAICVHYRKLGKCIELKKIIQPDEVLLFYGISIQLFSVSSQLRAFGL